MSDDLDRAVDARIDSYRPDAVPPFAVIEARKRGRDRRRLAVGGGLFSVVAVAGAVVLPSVVPALQSTTTAPLPPQVAATERTTPAPTSYALDPRQPWAFRGTPVDESTRAAIQREYATRTQSDEVLVTPLFAQVLEPSGQLEVVFLAEVDGTYRWGVATTTEAGPELRWDQSLAADAAALAATLRGDEGARLLVVASPDAISIDYGPDGASEVSAMGELERGVAVVALSGDTSTDTYRVRLPDGVVTTPAPDAENPFGVTYLDLTATFVSPTYGYSFGYVARGGLTRATERWDPGNQPIDDLNSDPRFDAVETGYAAYFQAASTPVPNGVAIDEWVDERVTPRTAGGCGVPRSQQAEITVDGQPGRVADCGRIEATVVAGGRLYLFVLRADRTDNRAQFDAWMATVELTPDTAVRS